MNIIINASSMVPIYEQIMEAVKKAIASGELSAGDALPSVRRLANDLKISALTVKKAYDHLEEEGFTATVHGKGTYVASLNRELVKEQQRKEIERDLSLAAAKARGYGLEDGEVRQMLEIVLERE